MKTPAGAYAGVSFLMPYGRFLLDKISGVSQTGTNPLDCSRDSRYLTFINRQNCTICFLLFRVAEVHRTFETTATP
jgi:hypothetical protein